MYEREYEGRDKIHENTESGAYVVFLMSAMMSTSVVEKCRVISRILARTSDSTKILDSLAAMLLTVWA
jgi:hypothetical protein